MAIYAIGDLQGCYSALQRLLETLQFDPSQDQLWFSGDLVNRGPESLDCLRFVKNLGSAAVTVLGNHDLHLLAVIAGVRKPKRGDTLDDILQASDRDELAHWLRQQPLLHQSADGANTLVHAGIYPGWTLAAAKRHAAEISQVLQSPDYARLIQDIYGNQPDRWSEQLQDIPRWRFIINAFTRMRFCRADGQLDFDHKLGPGSQPPDLKPWYDFPQQHHSRIVFGHWSTLGPLQRADLVALDTGCIWGGCLSALRLDGDAVMVKVGCEEFARP